MLCFALIVLTLRSALLVSLLKVNVFHGFLTAPRVSKVFSAQQIRSASLLPIIHNMGPKKRGGGETASTGKRSKKAPEEVAEAPAEAEPVAKAPPKRARKVKEGGDAPEGAPESAEAPKPKAKAKGKAKAKAAPAKEQAPKKLPKITAETTVLDFLIEHEPLTE
jgi:outer membrane biosynthesis protein TonB